MWPDGLVIGSGHWDGSAHSVVQADRAPEHFVHSMYATESARAVRAQLLAVLVLAKGQLARLYYMQQAETT